MNQHSLDYIGIMEDTDKTSVGNDYLRHYERVVSHFRDDPIVILEIGVAEGASLRTWERFFPRATIIGADNNDKCLAYAGGRIKVEIGSQGDPDFLTALGAKYSPTIIIDDGSHQSAHVFLTFEHLFGCLLPGGIYIMEDLYLHNGAHAPKFHSQGGATPSDYLSIVARGLAARYLEPDADPATRQIASSIDRIEFISGAIIVQKRATEFTQSKLDDWFEAATIADKPHIWFHLSLILMNHNDLTRGEFAAERALAISPDRVAFWPRLADAQARRGKFALAAETLREGIRRDPTNESLQSTLANIEGKLGAG